MKKWPRAHLIRYFDVGNSDAVLVTSLEAHKEILHEKAYSFQKPPFFVKLIADIVGIGGLGFAEGEVHKRQRRGLACELSFPLCLFLSLATHVHLFGRSRGRGERSNLAMLTRGNSIVLDKEPRGFRPFASHEGGTPLGRARWPHQG